MSVVESWAGGMQKTLTRVEACTAPPVRSPPLKPDSSIIVASACAKAPLRFCSQLVKGTVVHCESAAHACGGFWKPPTGSLQKPQKMLDLPFPAPVLNAVFDAVPVVRLKGIGSAPISAPACGGGQSWLVG